MDLTANHWMMIAGAVLLLVAYLVRRWTAKYDLKDASLESAWHVARGRRSTDSPTAIESKISDITSAPTVTGKATRAAGAVAGHFFAQAMGLASLAMGLLGSALVLAGAFWR